MVPLAAALAAIFVRQATLPAVRVRAVRLARRAMDAKQVALAGVIPFLLQVYQHLYLDAARVGSPHRRQRVGPHEKARITDLLLIDVHPLELRDEALVLLFGAQEPGRLACGNDLSLLHEKMCRGNSCHSPS